MKLTDLIQRLDKMGAGSNPYVDPALDADIWAYFKQPGTPPPLTESMDASRQLIDSVFGIAIITISWDPSGEGCRIIWYPYGLSGEREIIAEASHWTVPLAMLSAALDLAIYMETEDRKTLIRKHRL